MKCAKEKRGKRLGLKDESVKMKFQLYVV